MTWRRAGLILAIILPLWLGPIVGLGWWFGWQSTMAEVGIFFSKAALVTFGGAYAVLPYVAQQAVDQYQWLDHSQMMAGLALAETTPGPLIMVLQFVGFLAGWQQAGVLSPTVAALLCAMITTWVTFLPSFLFIFLGAPHIEKISEFPKFSATLVAVTASVVGVILNLGVSFANSALWPSGNSASGNAIDVWVLGIAILAFIALRSRKPSMIQVIALSGIFGILASLI